MSAVHRERNGLDDRLIERCEHLPADPTPGDYVVIDTLHFSNTVIELLARGATAVHVPDERGGEFEYRANNPSALIGGGHTENYEPAEGYDFFNSPSYVSRMDVEGRPVSMTSTNGGRTVATLREQGGPRVEVFIGAPLNARAVGEFLRERDRPVRLVAAGCDGERAVEDLVGAAMISRYVDGLTPAQAELELWCEQIETARGPSYVQKNELRRRDVLEFATSVNARSVIPRLDGTELQPVEVTDRWQAAARGIAD